MRWHLRLPSPAMTVALIALFVALGGTGYAATQLSSRDTAYGAKKHHKHKQGAVNDTTADTSLFAGLLTSAAPTLSVASAKTATTAGTAGSATMATTAGSAATASTAGSATTAATAGNANNLGGSPPAAYQLRIRWAYVHADGTIGAQSGGFSLADHSSTGTYFLNVGVNAAGQAIMVTPHWDQGVSGLRKGEVSAAACGDTSGTDDPDSGAIRCSLNATVNDSKNVRVDVLSSDGTAGQDEGFYIQLTA